MYYVGLAQNKFELNDRRLDKDTVFFREIRQQDYAEVLKYLSSILDNSKKFS